ncbi:MAG: cation:proton antiporter, partial [Methanobacteriota archaeon]
YGLDLMDIFFIAIVFSLTALPVGVQILMDLGKLESETGKIIITSAVNGGLPINHVKLLEISFIIGIFYAGTIIKKSTVGEGVFSNVHNVVSSITSSFFSPILFAYLGLLLNLSLLFDPAHPDQKRQEYQGDDNYR